MSKSAVLSHRKPRLSFIVFLILLFTVVSVSFGTIIYSAGSNNTDSNNKEKNREKSVLKTNNLEFILGRSAFLKNSALNPDSTFIVNSNGDSNDVTPGDGICLDSSGNCTLRAAIQEANATDSADEIIFALPTPTTIQLNSSLAPEELTITKALTIIGPGARLLTINGVVTTGARNAESPNASSAIFNINTTTSVTTTISALTIANTAGRGINNAGKLNLSDVTIRGHQYGIYNSGNLNLTRALIRHNSKGGIYAAASSVTNISNTTVTNNQSSDHGGGIHSLSSDLTLNNVTISNNGATSSGGGLYYNGSSSGVYVRNTIIANNNAPSGPDILSANSSTGINFTSRGNNLIGKSDGNIGFENGSNGDKVGTIAAPIDPLLRPLQNNGGQTDTVALQTGSPARDAGNNCVTNSNCGGNNPPTSLLLTDQRGTDFPRNFESGVDIGAFESFYPAPTLNSISPTTWGAGSGAFDLTVNGSNFVRDSVVKWNGQDRFTIFISNTQLRAQIVASDVTTASQNAVSVANPQPGGGVSETINFTVADCTFSINPTSQNFTQAGGNGSITVTSINGCAWTATSSNSWITINSGNNGRGNGTVSFSVAANPGLARNGTISIGGQTFAVSQESGCTFSINPTNQTIAAAGGTGSFAVTSNSGCVWETAASHSWITITGGASGTGNGTVNFSVAPNTGPQRTGTITVAGQTFTITQNSGCSYSLAPTNASIQAGGGTGNFNVTAGTGCTWAATSNDSWITITGGASGTGNGTVNFSVAPNTGFERTGTITVEGQTFTITQASGCTITLSPSSATVAPAGGPGSFNVATPAGCGWTAASSASWITVTGGSPGTGNGTVNFTVAANTGPARSGTITVGNKTFTVSQENGCTFTLSPSSLNTTPGGGTGFFDVTSGAGCTWTASSSASWITVTGGSSGTGNGRVNFTVAANTGPARTGTITVGGQVFTINQENGCTFTINPTGQNFTAAGGSGNFTITASNSGCTWNAVASDSWITIAEGSSGSGNGTINFTVAVNTGPARTGTITVGGRTFTINQVTGCTYSISSPGTSFPPAGGSGSFNVTVNNQACTWTATTSTPWITINAPTTGTGNGVVSFTVAPNVSPVRSGTISVNGQTFTITQENGCTYTLSASSANIPAAGGTGNFNVNSGAGCAWTIQSNASWITITSSSNGSGSGAVTFSVAANNGPDRSGTITAAGQTFTVHQANGCSFSLSSSSGNFTAAGGPGSFTVTASHSGCSWSASVNDTWITITAGASGTGNGTVQFTVTANVSPQRIGTITVGNSTNSKTFTITQANGCTYSISPTSTGVDELGGIRSFSVSSGPGCPWTAVSNDSWITVTGGVTGSGNGTVTISVAATAGAERSGTVTAAGHTFTVNQISLRVTNLNDSGIGSLRRAVANANTTPNSDVITFLPTLAGTIVLTTGEIRIENNGSIEIRGPGANTLRISGNNNSRIFYIDNATVTISGLTLRNGNGVGEDSLEFERYGGAIYSNHDRSQGSLTLDRVDIYNNSVSVPEGGGSRSIGGGVYYFGGLNHRIENSTFSFNRSDFGAGFYNFGPMSVSNSTFYGNTAKRQGGAMYAVADVKLRSTTITQNSTTDTGHTGAGIMIEGGVINIGNTIVSENSGPDITYVAGGFNSIGNNLIGDTPGDSANTNLFVPYNPSDIRDVPPLIATLFLYGGSTPTAPLMPGSPAINAANGIDVPATDQRGSTRVIDGIPDIGAFEQNITISPLSSVLPNASLGVFYNQALSTFRSDNTDPSGYFEYFIVDGFLTSSGIDLIQESGVIRGTPTRSGEYVFTVRAVGADGMAGANRYSIRVGCAISINPANQSFNPAGGTGTINVTSGDGCVWTAASNSPWITVTGGGNGNGNGTINFSVASNGTGSARSGKITIGEKEFTVNQASDCTFSLNPTNQSVAGSGGTGNFAITASGSSCAWNAAAGSLWITITGGGSGTGSGTVNFSVAANNTGAARTGTITAGGQTFTINQSFTPAKRVPFEFDGDGKADLAVFRPSNGSWYILGSRDGFSGVGFGIGTDKPVPADYDGDGKTDIAVFRDGAWYVLQSRDGFAAVSFGQAEDIPQPGDYDGDGKADAAVFRPSNGSWYVLQSRDGFAGVGFGIGTDKPVPADYDGDGKTDIAVFRDGAWYVLQSRDGFAAVSFGIATDKPIAADYDGDGKADIGVYRDGVWHLLRSRDGYASVGFGIGTDKPVPADYDGDGKTDIAVFRDGTWHMLDSGQSESQAYRAVQFGESSDIPIPASLQ